MDFVEKADFQPSPSACPFHESKGLHVWYRREVSDDTPPLHKGP